MPEEGIALLDHSSILSFDEIVSFTEIAVRKGIDKVRVTGGEPLVRRGVTTLISKLASIEGIKDLSMTTNGTLLERYAQELKDAGLMRVNISMDTCDPERFREITRGGDIETLFRGVDAAKKAGLTPIKINCVIENSSEERDAQLVAQYAQKEGLLVRYIPKMDLEHGVFGVVEGGSGGDCAKCNRLRLNPTGVLRPCLFSDIEIDIRKDGAEAAIEKALRVKPLKGGCNHSGNFYNIGG